MFFIHWPLVKIKKGKAVGGAKAQPAQVTQQSWFNIFTSLEPCFFLNEAMSRRILPKQKMISTIFTLNEVLKDILPKHFITSNGFPY